MKRRTLLAGTGAAVSVPVAGCVDRVGRNGGPVSDESQGCGDNGTGDEEGTNSSEPASPPRGDCGPSEEPLSELLTDDPGAQSACFDGAKPSFALENERDSELTVAVDLGDDELAETYALEAGERVVEDSAFEAQSDRSGAITVEGEETQLEWSKRSCYRHGVAIVPDGVETGWIEPHSGPGDTQHDCYAGDDTLVTVVSRGEGCELSVTSLNRCTGEEVTEAFAVDADDPERTRALLTAGGRYDLEVDVESGDSAHYEFREACWGVEVRIEESGEVRFIEHDID